jgi:hypothetical protein
MVRYDPRDPTGNVRDVRVEPATEIPGWRVRRTVAWRLGAVGLSPSERTVDVEKDSGHPISLRGG